MKSLKRTKWLVLLLVAVLIIPLFQSITINAAGLVTLDHSTFETGKDGWGARYGGSTSRSTDIAYSGNYSLKLINRKKSWHAAGKNLYSVMRSNGSGTYYISMKIYVTAIDPNVKKIGLLIRTTEANSFSDYHDGVYYCRLMSKTSGVQANTWMTLSGSVHVSPSDISASDGTFDLMFDLLEPVDGQVVYIDEITIEKQDSFNVSLQSGTVLIGEGTRIITNKSSGVTYTSLNPDKAYVSSSGEVIALKPGYATFKVQYGDAVGSCVLRIKTPTTPTSGITSGECYYLKNYNAHTYTKHKDYTASIYLGADSNKTFGRYSIDSANTETLFRFEYVTDGVYKISLKSDGRDVLDGVSITRNSLQRWYVIKVGNGYRLIRQGDYKMIAMSYLGGAPYITDSVSVDTVWMLKRGQVQFTGTQLYGITATNYGTENHDNCSSGYRGSATVIAEHFAAQMSSFDEKDRKFLFIRRNSDATKDDVLSKADYSISKDNIDDVDFMMFVGHGYNSSMHFDYDSQGRCHSDDVDNHYMYDNAFMFTHEEAKFGKGNSRTKWVAAYTCNYLNDSVYSYDDLKKKMEGVNIVLGFSTKCLLTTDQTDIFSTQLLMGTSIIDAWVQSASVQKKKMSKRTVVTAMYVEEAYNDNIYSYYPNAGTYRTEDIKIKNVVIREN